MKGEFEAALTAFQTKQTELAALPVSNQTEIDAKTVATAALETMKKALQKLQVESDKAKKANDAYIAQRQDKEAAEVARALAERKELADGFAAATTEFKAQ